MMNFIDRIDPALRPVLEMIPADLLDLNDIPGTRAKVKAMFSMMPTPVIEGVSSRTEYVPGPSADRGSGPEVMVRIYEPSARPENLPALLWIHGGGYVLGDVDMDDAKAAEMAVSINCVVVSVEYRLAPEHPFPAPVEDCYAALVWLANNAAALGVDASRIAIGGASAGGGLTAGLALLARDRGEVNVAFQLPIYPMIDDRCITPSSHAITDPRVWNRESNLLGWQAYLGHEPGSDDTSPYAAATRATDLSGLPPAYIPVGEMDLFLDENIEYAQRLIQAGVPTELHIYQGSFHGSDSFAPDVDSSKRFLSGCKDALRRALHG
ncbi:MAG: alpha/beta hydrolase [Chloroflexota bacterium]